MARQASKPGGWSGRPLTPHGRSGVFRPAPAGPMLAGMLSGSLLHHWLVTGLSAFTFLLFLKVLAPHLPDGLQKLIASA